MVPIRPIRLFGKWRQGYALDRHTVQSVLVGHDEFGNPQFDTKRTPLGELLYQLKYRSDASALKPIVETVVAFVQQKHVQCSVLIPVPPSREGRTSQPVMEIAIAVARTLGWHLSSTAVAKTKPTTELKDVHDYQQRLRVLNGAFVARPAEVNGRSVLLFDDLYRSGATLSAVTDALLTAGAADVFVLTLTRTKRS